jgi:hypothetical protein
MRKSPWLLFTLIFCWKLALFLFSAQPIPANDAFFYDGAVIHKLLYGGYYNPCIAIAFPISGTTVFSTYPPLYQFVLLGWMAVFGTSALAAMALHLALFGGYMLTLLAIFRRLNTPAWCVNISSGFLLVMTWHDRPDSLAELLGTLAVYFWIRSRRILDTNETPGTSRGKWHWCMAVCVVLAFCTSLQIGATYLGIVTLGTLAACYYGREKIPFGALIAMFVLPLALVLLVKIALPVAWEGFMQNVRQTPFLTGLRMPHVPEILKIVRSVPGIIVILLMLPASWFIHRQDHQPLPGRQHLVLSPMLLVASGISLASLCLISANTVGIASCLQPVLVAVYLTICSALIPRRSWLRLQIVCMSLAILLGAVRAIGMSTWGLACAADVGYSKANQYVDAELADSPKGSTVVMSSAFLYNAAKFKDINLVHCDWMEKAGGDSRISDLKGLFNLKPREMILTQYDYYRRFERVLDEAKNNPALSGIQITNTAKTPAPDSIEKFQHVVQHISWAPVIIKFSWRD